MSHDPISLVPLRCESQSTVLYYREAGLGAHGASQVAVLSLADAINADESARGVSDCAPAPAPKNCGTTYAILLLRLECPGRNASLALTSEAPRSVTTICNSGADMVHQFYVAAVNEYCPWYGAVVGL